MRNTEQTFSHRFSMLYTPSVFPLVRKESQIHQSPSVYFLLLSPALLLIHHFITLFPNILPSPPLVKQVKVCCLEKRKADSMLSGETSSSNAQLRTKLWSLLDTLVRHQTPNVPQTSFQHGAVYLPPAPPAPPAHLKLPHPDQFQPHPNFTFPSPLPHTPSVFITARLLPAPFASQNFPVLVRARRRWRQIGAHRLPRQKKGKKEKEREKEKLSSGAVWSFPAELRRETGWDYSK